MAGGGAVVTVADGGAMDRVDNPYRQAGSM